MMDEEYHGPAEKPPTAARMPAELSAVKAPAAESTALLEPTRLQEPLLELLDTLQRHQLRNAGAEVAAAIAHSMGTALNVISGRAELIRQNPAGALVQVGRIDEQVQKLAKGLRQLVDYLAVPEPAPEASALAGEPALMLAAEVLEQARALASPLATARGVVLTFNGQALGGVAVDRWHVLGTLNMLLSLAIHWAGAGPIASDRHIQLSGGSAEGWVSFELSVPSLELMTGWELEHFRERPPATRAAEPYRMLSICGAMVRGRGGKLQLESTPGATATMIRFACRSGSGAS